MLRYWLVIAGILAVALVTATTAEARVTLVRVTSPVSAGSYATLTVKVSRPARAPADLPNARSEPPAQLSLSPSTERRRSRTDRAVGYTTALVLKTSWATGPMPLHGVQ
jgi:hypothetical protein